MNEELTEALDDLIAYAQEARELAAVEYADGVADTLDDARASLKRAETALQAIPERPKTDT